MVGSAEIIAAADRADGRIRRTPVLRIAGDPVGLRHPLVLKLEFLQHTGSFKPRGAFNSMLSAALPGAGAGVIAASGGNHGAAVAFAAREIGLRAEIFVPEITLSAKLARISSYGVSIVQRGATYADAFEESQKRQKTTGAFIVHAYDDPHVIAGQGTVAKELAEDAPELTHVLVAVGGGGLIGGIGAWYAGCTHVVGVEPSGCPCLHEALLAGTPVPAPVGGIAADSLGARQVGALSFAIAQRFAIASVLVTDEAIRGAQRWLWDRLRIVVEPGGATALAALLSGAFTPPDDARVGVVLCGANVDLSNAGIVT